MAAESAIQKIYPLSPLQEGILFHWLLDNHSPAFFIQWSFAIEGVLNVELLEKSFSILTSRHDIFRTNFYVKAKKPQQVVFRERPIAISFKDISHLSKEEHETLIKRFKQEDRENGFDLTKGTLMRIAVFQTGPESYMLVWSHHHILMDGWCIGIITDELFEIYGLLNRDKTPVLKPASEYKKFIDWLQLQDKEDALKYWGEYLAGYEQLAVLPKSNRVSNENFGKFLLKRSYWMVEEDWVKNLEVTARSCSITLNILFQCLWGILLQKYNNQNDVVFGMVISGRPPEIPGIESMVGLFINTIPVRIKSEPETSFADLAKQVHKSLISSMKYGYLSLSAIQSYSKIGRDLVDHLVAFENFPIDSNEMQRLEQNLGLKISDSEYYSPSNYDFTLAIITSPELALEFSFNAVVYSFDYIERIKGHFRQLVKQVVDNPYLKIEQFDILTETEKQQIIYDYNRTEAEYPWQQTISQLFEAQAQKTPDRIALVYDNEELTYRDLDEKTSQLAQLLTEKGIKSNCLVGLMLENSPETIIGILGILKAGGAYIPIDTDYPPERISTILNDSKIQLLLTKGKDVNEKSFSLLQSNSAKTDEASGAEKGYNREIFLLDHLSEIKTDTLQLNLKEGSKSSDLAYVIYTSGSTGTPKGVGITQRGLVNYIWWARKIYLNGEKLDFALYSSISFDLTVTSIFTPLISGNKVVIYHDQDKALLIRKILMEDHVGIVKLTPTHLHLLEGLELNPVKLKKLIVGGEDLKTELARKIYNRFDGRVEIYNEYGPTETVVGCMIHRYNPDNDQRGSVPIGTPADNVQIYLLNQDLQPVPEGVMGDIYISGDGVAEGYLNQPELTKERFLANPFQVGKMMYHTGDMAIILPNGKLEFSGREDNQVKIRGYRIELVEIENQILKHHAVKEATVVVIGEDENKYLCAYHVSEEKLLASELQEYLRAMLPDYMLPARFVQLDAMPLTANGKINRKVLPNPDESIDTRGIRIAPENEVESILVKIWEEVLGIKGLGTNEKFFELGGDSIKAIQVASRLANYKMTVELQDILRNPTIKELSEDIQIKKQGIDQSIIVGEVGLTPIQREFFQYSYPKKNHFNQSIMLYRSEGFDTEIVREVFNCIVEHHDGLRIVYRNEAGEIIQYNRGMEGELFNLQVIEGLNEAGYRERIEEIANKSQEEIDLENGPLVRLSIFNTAHGDYLLIIIHHLVVDGVSWRILLEDFTTGYQQALKKERIQLPEKTTSFKEWSEKLSIYANGYQLLKEIPYWSQLENTEIKPFPKDKIAAEENTVRNAETVIISITESETEKLIKQVNRAYNTEINDILLTALGLAIRDWTGAEKMLVDLEGHGRESINEEINITRTIGWFTVVYPVILNVSPKADLSILIKSVKESLHQVPNKGLGYGLLRYLTNEENSGGLNFHLRPEIGFNYLGQFDVDFKTEIFQPSDISSGRDTSPEWVRNHGLDINSLIIDGRLKLNFSFNKFEYEQSNILRFSELYRHHLLQIMDHCLTQNTIELTPSDFGDQELSLEEFETISKLIAN